MSVTVPAPQARKSRAMRLLSTVIASLMLVSMPLAVPAFAEPDDASDAARNATTLAELDAAIAQLEAEQKAAYEAVLQAGEEYVTAVDEYQKASDFADAAAEKAQVAGERAQESRRFIARIARESSRGSNSLDALGAFLLADGLETLITEAEALNKVNAKTDERLQQFEADKLVADILQRKALEATQEAREKRDAATDALGEAQRLEAQAEQKTQQAEVRRGELIAQAAAARQASIEEEQRRQDELARQRQEAEEQAARERIARQEEQSQNNNVEVDEAPRPQPSQSAQPEPEPSTSTSEPTRTAEPTQSPEPEPTRTSSSPSPSPTRTSEPEPTREPEPTSSPSPSPTPTSSPSPSPTPTSTPTPTPTPSQPTSDPYGLGKGRSSGSATKGQTAIAEARKHLGKPYLFGGTGPNAFDCSGLTSVAWSAAGVNITRTSRSQYKQVLKIKISDMRPGDLLFWGSGAATNDADSITHVAMYIGNGQMIEASQPGVPLRITSVRYDSRLMPYAGRP